MTQLLNLTAKRHESRVLGSWLAERDGGMERAGLVALGENVTTSGLTADELVAAISGSGKSAAGIQVSADNALRVSTVYACVSLIAGAMASLQLGIFERDTRKEVAHDYWWLFNEQASDEWTSAAAWEYLFASKLLYGDGIGQLLRPSIYSNRVIGWKPLERWRVQPFRDERSQDVYYRVTPERGAPYVLDAADVLHLSSFGFDGVCSPSPITQFGRETIGTAIAADRFSGQFFAEGATFDYALKSPKKLDEQQYKQLRTSLLARTASGGRGPLILTGGLEPANLSVTPKDAEMLASRQHSVEEICRMYGVPPHLVGMTSKSTSFGSGIAEQGGNFVRYTLLRHLAPTRQELNRKLWPTRERYVIRHITEAFERGDVKSRSEANRIAIGRAGEPGWKTVNEVRAEEGMPPIDGGDKLNTGAQDAQTTPPAAG